MNKEAKARIKINKLLEDSGWRLLDTPEGKANVLLENNIKITKEYIETMGDNFDYLWDTEHGNPEIVTSMPMPESFKQYNQFNEMR